MTQKSTMRPATYGVVGGNIVDEPFRATNLHTGVFARAERPEYGETYRNHAAAIRAALKE